MMSYTKQNTKNEDFSLPEKPYKKIAVTFIILTLLLVLIIVYFSLSKATVVLQPAEVLEKQDFVLKLPLTASSTPAAVLSGNYNEQEIELVKSFEIKNFTNETGTAGGLITIKNENNQAQTLIATTRFLSPDNKLFRLKKQVTVPAGGEVTAEVEADEEGSAFDIAPTKFTIPGLNSELQKKIYGISTEAMTGGTRKVGKLTAEEIVDAQKEIENNLDELVAEQVVMEKEDGMTYLTANEIVSQDISNKEGDAVEKFTITLKIKVETVAVPKDKVLAWVKDKYKDEMGMAEDILNYNLEDFNVSLEKIAPTYADLEVSLSAYVMGNFDLETLDKKKLYGLDEMGVKIFFMQYEGVKDVKVNFWPFWVRSVPSMEDHIEIRIEE